MDAPVREGDLLAGKYRVEKVLGYGGMGVVVSAFRGDLEQRVAVKFLSQAAAERPDAAERFRREARAAAKIRSEHVARVLDVGTLDGGLPYMVMEFLEGNDIADELRRVERLPIADAVEFTLQAIEALAEAHAGGVVHRDLKPGNLFLAQRADGSRRVKVLDFGISKAMSGSSVEELSLTKTAALIGSPLYMAPEQMRSAKDVDTRADIWSLGAMLYEMLTGQPPYMAESIPQLCAALLHDDPVSLRQHRPEIPEGLDLAVLRCLMKDREQRFPSVFELGRALLPYGTPEGRFHVERAERVLGVKDATLSGLPPGTNPSWSLPRSSTPAMSVPITPLAVTPSNVMNAQAVAAAPPIADPTINSWGQSGMHQAPSRRGPIMIVALVAAVAAAGIGLWVARGQSSDTKLPAASPSVDAPKVEVKAPEPPPTVVPSESPVAATPPAPSVPSTATPPVPEPPPPSVATVKPRPGAPSHTPVKKPETAAVAPPPPPPTSKPGGVTDFGGRR